MLPQPLIANEQLPLCLSYYKLSQADTIQQPAVAMLPQPLIANEQLPLCLSYYKLSQPALSSHDQLLPF
jgi:hypothetical protein